MSERRRYPRVPCPLRLKADAGISYERWLTVYNISRGGLCITLDNIPSPRQEVAGSLYDPATRLEYSFTARVIWSRNLLPNVTQVGLAFEAVSPELHAWLERYTPDRTDSEDKKDEWN